MSVGFGGWSREGINRWLENSAYFVVKRFLNGIGSLTGNATTYNFKLLLETYGERRSAHGNLVRLLRI